MNQGGAGMQFGAQLWSQATDWTAFSDTVVKWRP